MFGGESKAAVVNSETGIQKSKDNPGSPKIHFCKLLNCENERPADSELKRLWKSVEQKMAVVPSGRVALQEIGVTVDESNRFSDSMRLQQSQVESFYMDKTAVTNADFLQFVKAGCYEDTQLWDQNIWSKVTQMVDQSGQPGPKFWHNGKPPRELMEHPVVGICWYEAKAYAQWVGKQLPTAGQWQRAATWHHTDQDEGSITKFTWGGIYETQYANAWASGIGSTAPVDEYYDGATPNGIFQLIGNTWEWIDGPFEFQNQPENQNDLVEIRGGAFDTYLDSQMTCQFRSGQSRSHRSPNLGFRCIVPVKNLHRP